MKTEFFENWVLYLGCQLNEPSAGKNDIWHWFFSVYVYLYMFSGALGKVRIVDKSYSLPRSSIAEF